MQIRCILDLHFSWVILIICYREYKNQTKIIKKVNKISYGIGMNRCQIKVPISYGTHLLSYNDLNSFCIYVICYKIILSPYISNIKNEIFYISQKLQNPIILYT